MATAKPKTTKIEAPIEEALQGLSDVLQEEILVEEPVVVEEPVEEKDEESEIDDDQLARDIEEAKQRQRHTLLQIPKKPVKVIKKSGPSL